jgi:hypothetical protein
MFRSKHGSQEGLRQRMIADGATTFAKKVAWVRKHIPSVTDPQSFVGWSVASESKQPRQKRQNPSEELYHGSPEDLGQTLTVEAKGVFDGVFCQSRQAAQSHGNYLYKIEIPTAEIADTFDLAYGDKALAAFLKTCFWLEGPDDPRVDDAWTATVEDRADSLDDDSLAEALNVSISDVSDRADASWYAQKLRGKIAKELGFRAVRMSDEHGSTVLVLPPAKLQLVQRNPAQPAPPAGFSRYRVLSSSWGADAVTHKRALLYTVKAPDGRTGNLTPHSGVYRFHEQLELFGSPVQEEFTLTAPVAKGSTASAPSRAPQQLGLFANPRRNPQVLTGAVREIPDGSGLGIKTFHTHGGKRKAEWLPVPANLPDWRADLAQGKRLSHPKGLRKSPFVQDVNGQKVSEAIAPNGQKVWVGWQVVDLSKLRTSHDPWTLQVNSAYPQELQPRDRSRKSYADQIGRLVAQFDPALLVWSATISDGAPIVGDDGVVESGNGRTMALSRVYRTGGAKADEYRQAVKLWAAELEIPVPKVPHPVLVRVRQTAVDRAEFARMANVSAMQLMSAGEQAVTDAASMTADLILQLDPDRSVGAGANSGFVDGFIAQVAGRTARGQLVDEKGRLSKSGENRIDLAIFAFAYGAEAQILINELAEVRESDLRTALSGMLDGAARVARLRAGIAAGLYHAQHDPSDGLVHMANFVRAAKLAGQTVDQRLAQATMFEPLPRTSELWLQALRPKGSRLSAAALAAAIVAYCQWVDLYPAGQATMFDEQPPAQIEVIQRALRGGPEG